MDHWGPGQLPQGGWEVQRHSGYHCSPLLHRVVFAPVAAPQQPPTGGVKKVSPQEGGCLHSPAHVLLLSQGHPSLGKARDHQPCVGTDTGTGSGGNKGRAGVSPSFL